MTEEGPSTPLRVAAEEKLARVAPDAPSVNSNSELLHELQVHQIELEMQNEALRQSQVELEAARDRYLDLYEFAPVGYLTLTPSGQITEANLAAAAMLGVDRRELRETRFDRAVHAGDRTRWERAFISAKVNAAGATCDVALARRDGSPGPDVHADIRCATAAGGQVSLRVTLADITARKRAEVALEQYRDRLEVMVAERTAQLAAARDDAEAANRAKSAFLANMSHEIRTPLNGILGLAYLVRRAGVTPKQAEQLDKVAAAGQHLLAIINDVLDLARIEAGKIVLKETDFGRDQLLRELIDMIGNAAESKGLVLRTDLAGIPEWLHGDATRLKQALLNYLGNAVKFTEQGTVTLEGRMLEETAGGCLVRFAVRDTGIGIGAEAIGKLFAPFQQTDDSLTRAFGGTGLGLVIARRIAGLMGGEAGVDNTSGKGSTFWLTVRLRRGQPPHAPSVRNADEPAETRLRRDHGGARILVAEDEVLGRDVLLELLQLAGLSPDLAVDGRQAVQMAERSDYALILMDVQMPGMTGLEATRAIRRLPGRADTPIVALTAGIFEENRHACVAAGMTDFVAKPLQPEKLFATVLKWLESR